MQIQSNQLFCCGANCIFDIREPHTRDLSSCHFIYCACREHIGWRLDDFADVVVKLLDQSWIVISRGLQENPYFSHSSLTLREFLLPCGKLSSNLFYTCAKAHRINIYRYVYLPSRKAAVSCTVHWASMNVYSFTKSNLFLKNTPHT